MYFINIPYSREFEISADSSYVCDLFIAMLGGRLDSGGVWRMDIHVTLDGSNHLQYHYNEDGFGMDIQYFLNPLCYAKLKTGFERRRVVLDIIYKVFAHVAAHEKWNLDLVLDIYRVCVQNNVCGEWWFNNKILPAPESSHHIGIYNILYKRHFECYLVLLGPGLKEIARHLVLRQHNFRHEVSSLTWANPDTVAFTIGKWNNVFRYSIEDMVMGDLPVPLESIHYLYRD